MLNDKIPKGFNFMLKLSLDEETFLEELEYIVLDVSLDLSKSNDASVEMDIFLFIL